MKRRILFLAVMSLLAFTGISAQSPMPGTPVELEVGLTGPVGGGGNPGGDGNSHPRGPVLMPEVNIDGYTLYFGGGFDFTLQLVDEDDTVVYSTFVFSNTPSIMLPSYLLGEYELRLVTEEYTYYGSIIL